MTSAGTERALAGARLPRGARFGGWILSAAFWVQLGCGDVTSHLEGSDQANRVLQAAGRMLETLVEVAPVRDGEWSADCLDSGDITLRQDLLARNAEGEPTLVRQTVTYEGCADLGVVMTGVLLREVTQRGSDAIYHLDGELMIEGDFTGWCRIAIEASELREARGTACGFAPDGFSVPALYP